MNLMLVSVGPRVAVRCMCAALIEQQLRLMAVTFIRAARSGMIKIWVARFGLGGGRWREGYRTWSYLEGPSCTYYEAPNE